MTMTLMMVTSPLTSVVLLQSLLPSLAFNSPAQQQRQPKIICGNHHYHHRHSCSALNLVPLSEAWSTNNNIGEEVSFSDLLPKLGCDSLNSQGMLIHHTTSSSSTTSTNNESPTSSNENQRYQLYLATTSDDLPPIAQLTIDVFDATVISLASSADWSMLERAIVEPVAGAYNAYAQAVAYTEVLSGLRRRMRNRLEDDAYGGVGDGVSGNVVGSISGGSGNGYDWLAPLVMPGYDGSSSTSSNSKTITPEAIAARSSIILALARPIIVDSATGMKEMEVAASVEVRLQPTDAKIPFSQPWLDDLERKLVRSIPFAREEQPAPPTVTTTTPTNGGDKQQYDPNSKSTNPPLRPYLCNLAVSPTLRSLGVGRALCRIVEAIAYEKWGYRQVYLHVDPANDAAVGLYEKEGYVDVGRRWNVVWADGAENISYYVKNVGE